MTFDISYSFPTPLLEDVGRIVDYIESHKVYINPSGTIAGKDLMEMNAIVSFSADDVGERTLERSIPFLFMVKTLLLQAGLVSVEPQPKGKSVLQPTPRLEGFKQRSPAEQYFFLLETLIVETDWRHISELMQGRGACEQ
jgi:hypothetical protein